MTVVIAASSVVISLIIGVLLRTQRAAGQIESARDATQMVALVRTQLASDLAKAERVALAADRLVIQTEREEVAYEGHDDGLRRRARRLEDAVEETMQSRFAVGPGQFVRQGRLLRWEASREPRPGKRLVPWTLALAVPPVVPQIDELPAESTETDPTETNREQADPTAMNAAEPSVTEPNAAVANSNERRLPIVEESSP